MLQDKYWVQILEAHYPGMGIPFISFLEEFDYIPIGDTK
jgi:hypothetical protein